MRVAVIGAGVVGASVARGLALRGADVTVFERDRPGAGTSTTTFGWINSHAKRPASYHRLNVEGCREHRRLADEAGGTPWYFPTGNLVWASDGPGQRRLDDRIARLDEQGYRARWLDRRDVAELEPDVRLPDAVERVAFLPDEGHVLPMPLLARLLGQAREFGAELACPVEIVGVEPEPAGLVVTTADGARHRFDTVVSCVGRWTPQLAATTGLEVPLADPDEPGGPCVGFLGYTDPVLARLSRVLTTPSINVRPDGGGRLVLQGLDLDGSADPAAPPGADSAIAGALWSRLVDVLPAAADSELAAVRVGQRALPEDGLPVVGFADTPGRFYLVVTHSGMTLGPLLGRLVAGELVDEAPAQLLADFRPQRLAGSASASSVGAARVAGEQ